MKIQIKDQGKQFVYEVSKVSHIMIGTEQLITSVYHPQSNGNDKIGVSKKKKKLVKVFDGNPCDWFSIIKGVLFALRVNKHTSTNFSPFFLVHNRDPTLLIDVKYNLVNTEGNESKHPFDKETFDVVLTNAISMRANIHRTTVKAFVGYKKTRPWL